MQILIPRINKNDFITSISLQINNNCFREVIKHIMIGQAILYIIQNKVYDRIWTSFLLKNSVLEDILNID